MATNEANTVWMKAYTPGGIQVGITMGFEDGELLSASAVDAMVADKGYLVTPPGVEPGEEIEIMTHVSRRMHTSKKDGTVTPVIAFYHENTALNWKYDHIYMNTPEQIAEFEQVTGLTMVNIPEWEALSFLDRADAKADKYIIATQSPVRVAVKEGTYKAQDGTTKTTMKIQRLLGANPPDVQNAQRPAWLSDDTETDKVKSALALLELDGCDVKIARSHVDPVINKFPTPELYLSEIERVCHQIADGK